MNNKPLPLNILVAEDNPVNQQLMLNLLEGLGYKVTLVTDGLAVLQSLETHTFDLIFMDIQMPRMDGLETSRLINARYGKTDRPKIIALTAFGMAENKRLCLEAGMDAYLTKPVSIWQLEQMLNLWPHGLNQALDCKPDSASLYHSSVSDTLPGSPEGCVDTADLLSRLGRNPENLCQMLKIFIEESEELIHFMQQAFDQDQVETMQHRLHQLKGICLVLSVSGIQPLLSHLEKQLKQIPIAQLAPEFSQLIMNVKSAQAELSILQDYLQLQNTEKKSV